MPRDWPCSSTCGNSIRPCSTANSGERIRGILAAIADAGPDSPDRIAGWLADDKRIWLALFGRSDQATSLAAAGHLSLLSGKPIAIDPSASDERRAQQIVELKALLAEN